MNIAIENALTLLPDGVRTATVYIAGNTICGIDDMPAGFKADKVIPGSGKFLIPGLVNAHSHAYMTVFRNCADDRSFDDWLFGKIMPIEDLCVCSNGTAVYSFDKHRAVVSFTMDESCLEAVRYFAARADKFDFLRITDNDFRFVFFRNGDDIESVLKKPHFPVYKMIIEHFSPEIAKRHYEEALKLFSDRFSVDMSGPRTLEIYAYGSGKGEALKRMIPLLNKKFDKIVCVGDNLNDIGMIKFADTGYAVGNATESLKAAADKITVESSEGAIAAVIRDLGNNG